MKYPNPNPDIPVVGRQKRGALVACFAATIAFALLAGCTSSLKDNGEAKVANKTGTSVATSKKSRHLVSPIPRDVEISIDSLERDSSGLATLWFSLENRSKSSFWLGDLLSVSGQSLEVVVADGDRVSRIRPLKSSGECACNANGSLESGKSAQIFVMFAKVPDAETARVSVPTWRPVDGVPVTEAKVSKPAKSASAKDVRGDRRTLTVQEAWRTDDGTVLRIAEKNDGAGDIKSFDLAKIGDTALIDPATGSLTKVRRTGSNRVFEETKESLKPGAEIVRDVLLGNLPDSAESATVTVPGFGPIGPVSIAKSGPETNVRYTASDLDAAATVALESEVVTVKGELVALDEPKEIPVTETGVEYDLPKAATKLTSEAQPGFTISPRAVVRSGTDRAVLFVDIDGVEDAWPAGIGSDEYTKDLGGLALIDTAQKKRYGVLSERNDPVDSSRAVVKRPRNGTFYVGFPAPDEATKAVTVDVPGFGQAPDVPVVASPKMDEEAPVLASTRPDWNPRLRIDILAVSRLADGAGTLLRFRAVNESDPDSVETPFLSSNGCDLMLLDPDSNRRFNVLKPCASTIAKQSVGNGEGVVSELRFPNLPSDVKQVVLTEPSLLSSPSVPVTDKARPWYLDLPQRADAPTGSTLRGAVGFADDLQTEKVLEKETVLDLNADVLFEFGSAALTPDSQARLTEVANRIAPEASGKMTIVGHTDNIGNDATNQTLSLQRAEVVAATMRSVLGSRVEITVEGKGASEPVAPNQVDGRDNPDGRARNRRVTLTYASS